MAKMKLATAATLCCAGCGNNWMHQIGFIWFQRDEDATTGVATHVDDHGRHASFEYAETSGTPNPSQRRGGSIVLFRCELCPAITGVHYAQHKGQTFVEVREVDECLISRHAAFSPLGASAPVEKSS